MTNDVAVFLDLDNLIIAAQKLEIPFDIQLVLNHLKRVTNGRIVLRRAYADWRQNQRVTEALAVAGFELQSAVRLNNFSKNLADMQMVVEAMETLIDGHDFTTYVLMTGDRDFTPLVQALRKRGKVVIGVGFAHTASRSLVNLCDSYFYYEELLEKSGQSKAAASRPQRARNGQKEASDAGVDLATRYARALKKLGLRVVPAAVRLVVLKEVTDYLARKEEAEWGEVLRDVYERHRTENGRKLSKNVINSVMIACKRAGVIDVGRGETLSAAPVRLDVESNKPFQEAVLMCDAHYLQEIEKLDMPFDLEQAAVALYESAGHARYLRIVHNRYNVNGKEGE